MLTEEEIRRYLAIQHSFLSGLSKQNENSTCAHEVRTQIKALEWVLLTPPNTTFKGDIGADHG